MRYFTVLDHEIQKVLYVGFYWCFKFIPHMFFPVKTFLFFCLAGEILRNEAKVLSKELFQNFTDSEETTPEHPNTVQKTFQIVCQITLQYM